MRKSKFTDKQIVKILKLIEDDAPVVETLREKGVSKDTYYKYKNTFNGMKSIIYFSNLNIYITPQNQEIKNVN